MADIGWRRGSSPAARTGARQRAGLTPASASNTLSCQRETLHSQQLRSIKKSIDSDHGIYRVRFVFAAALRSRFGAKRRLMRRTKEHLISSPSPTAVLWRQACRAPGFRHGLGQQRWKRKGGAESACAKRWLQL